MNQQEPNTKHVVNVYMGSNKKPFLTGKVIYVQKGETVEKVIKRIYGVTATTKVPK